MKKINVMLSVVFMVMLADPSSAVAIVESVQSGSNSFMIEDNSSGAGSFSFENDLSSSASSSFEEEASSAGSSSVEDEASSAGSFSIESEPVWKMKLHLGALSASNVICRPPLLPVLKMRRHRSDPSVLRMISRRAAPVWLSFRKGVPDLCINTHSIRIFSTKIRD